MELRSGSRGLHTICCGCWQGATYNSEKAHNLSYSMVSEVFVLWTESVFESLRLSLSGD